MVSSSTVIVIILIYIGLLWCVALWTERFAAVGKSVVNNPFVYSLSLAVFCSSWTFFGSVGQAATSGLLFLTTYLGPTLIYLFSSGLLVKIIKLKNRYKITSIADFISVRYEKSEPLAFVVTIIALVGTIPYVSLQLKAILITFEVITANPSVSSDWIVSHVGTIIVILMVFFTIMFGVRRLQPAERHEGMVMAVAVESSVKLISAIAAGCFVAYFVFNGVDDIFSTLERSPDLFRASCENATTTSPVTWISYLLLSANAIICLPRQFHITVVENQSRRHVRQAIILFPLYLFLINLFIYPTALAGLISGYPESQADVFLLLLPMDQGNALLTMLVFLGGFSAATSMIMISSMTMATMISNHVLLPLTDLTPKLDFIARNILEARWLTVAGFITLGYLFERAVGHHFHLAEIGMLSFGAVFQFAPALFGGLFWRGGNKRGAVLGLCSGFIIWIYTLLIPAFVKSGLISDALLKNGPWGVELLKPQALLGLDSIDNISHFVFWSLLINTAFYILGSLFAEQDQESISHTEAFVGPAGGLSVMYDSKKRTEHIVVEDKYNILLDIFSRYFGRFQAVKMIDGIFKSLGLTNKYLASIKEIAELYEDVEKNLGGSIGSASARRALERAEFFTIEEAEELREMYAEILADLGAGPKELKKKIDYHQEREALINKHAIELEEKIIELEQEIEKRQSAELKLRESEERYRLAIEGSSDGVILIRNLTIIWGNKRLPEIFGYDSLDQIIGKSLSTIVHPDDVDAVNEISLSRQKGNEPPSRYDFKGIKKDGAPIYIAVSATTINYHGSVFNMAYLRDVTSRRMAEEEIHHLSRRLIEGFEEERKKLASDLHDEFGQALTALHMETESARKMLNHEQDEIKVKHDAMLAIIEQLADNIRKVSTELRPDMLDHLGLAPTMEWYIKDLGHRVKGLEIVFLVTGFKDKKIDSQTQIVLYRILQEALNNVVKHAGASQASVNLTYSHPEVMLIIRDNGIGFEPLETNPDLDAGKGGIGLVSMKERVAAVGGKIDIRSVPGKGTVIRVTAPAVR